MKVKVRTILIYSSIVFFLLIGYIGYSFYEKVYGPITIPGESDYYLYIPTGTDVYQLSGILIDEGVIENPEDFLWLADKKNLANHLNPGRYHLHNGLNNNDLVNLIRTGKQSSVKVVFNNVRTPAQLAGIIAKQIEIDSVSLESIFSDDEFLTANNWNLQTVPALFIPNTYEFYWNTSAVGFFNRMEKEFNSFWTEGRLEKAEALGLTPVEVVTLASIVDEETYRDQELPRIAGVYLNRLKMRYRLGADPTVMFAKGDYKMTRVLKKDLEIDSPYNTYKHYGLPPGPISIPSIKAIDAVLNPEKEGYLYFCAKEDFSGYHNFAKTLKEHNRNARKYHNALNKRRIYK